MRTIDRVVSVEDFAVKGASETIGLAWFAVRQGLSALHSNCTVCTRSLEKL